MNEELKRLLILGLIFFASAIMVVAAVVPVVFAENLPQQFEVIYVLPTKVDTTQGEQTIFNLINQERIRNGLHPLIWDDTLASYSRKHSADMATARKVYHDKAELAAQKAGENALMMPRSYGGFGLLPYFYFNYYRVSSTLWEDSVQSWMDSPGYRANILTPTYTHTGIGIAIATDGVTFYATQDFK